MIRKCDTCPAFFDDEFRTCVCPHQTFAANDGTNHFAHHPESYLAPFDADLCNVIEAPTSGACWRVAHHLVAHPLLALSNGAKWAWRFHDWTCASAWPSKAPLLKREGLR